MITKVTYSILILVIIFIIVYACKHEPVDPNTPDPDEYTGECHPDTIYFEKDLLPILASSCARSGCHDAITQADGVRLTDYESVMATADVRPGNPNSSDLYEVLVEDDLDKRMPPPPNEPLSAAQIQMFYTWIMQGALNLHCEDAACDLENVTFSQTVFTNLQNYGCVNCHSGASPSGGILLDSYNAIKAVAESGALMGAIKRLEGYSPMPPTGDAMADCPADQIQKWIDDGMPDNK
jgi:cytochrome c5